MKRFIKKLIFKFLISIALFLVITAVITVLLNIKVTSRKGINFQVQTIKIPLYLKLINFFDRHYNYRQLVQEIIKNEEDDQKRAMKIFSWNRRWFTSLTLMKTPICFQPLMKDKSFSGMLF